MEESGSDFSWFMVYLISAVLIVAGVALGAMVWQHRRHKRERRAVSRKLRARVRAWRDSKSTPSQQDDLEHKNGL
jgi:Flp pilus assembly protein TadB